MLSDAVFLCAITLSSLLTFPKIITALRIFSMYLNEIDTLEIEIVKFTKPETNVLHIIFARFSQNVFVMAEQDFIWSNLFKSNC